MNARQMSRRVKAMTPADEGPGWEAHLAEAHSWLTESQDLDALPHDLDSLMLLRTAQRSIWTGFKVDGDLAEFREASRRDPFFGDDNPPRDPEWDDLLRAIDHAITARLLCNRDPGARFE